MSKIQKAIRQIERGSRKETTADETATVGTLVEKLEPASQPDDVGNETRQIAGFDISDRKHEVVVDRDKLAEAGFIAPESEQRNLVDQYRHIKRPLVAHAFGKRATKIEDGHLVLVTSALSGDGKTFSCINLALSLARESDQSVLLVDADTSKAHISHLFGIQEHPGLLDLLEKDSELTLKDTIVDTDVKGLSLMSAGKLYAHSTELLASNRMERLIRALSAENPHRIILFDSSPLLSTSESRVLSSLVGQIVMVVGAGKTPRPAVQEAIALIGEEKPVNLILNCARGVDGNSYYGGYYGFSSDSRREDKSDMEKAS